MELKVMTFNLRLNVSSDGENAWPYRVDAVVKKIREVQPEIFGTQEVQPSMLADLEDRLHEFAWVGEGRRGGMNDEMSAIFYRRDKFQAVENGTFWLSETPEIPGSQSWHSHLPRICTWARLRSSGDEQGEVYFFNTHLDHISEEARVNGVQVIVKKISSISNSTRLPVILTGDFNADQDSDAVRYVTNAAIGGRYMNNVYDFIYNMDKSVGCTFHGFEGGSSGKIIDYIFVTSDIETNGVLIDRSLVDGRYPSDHYPVIASLKLQ